MLAGPVAAKDFTVAVIYDQAGKFDKSFNEAAFNGAERFKKEFHINYREGQVSNDAQKEQMLRNIWRARAPIWWWRWASPTPNPSRPWPRNSPR
ncbi:hypothetical protein JOS77_29740 [Chromobacterium haemolyticum]|nr:hypothetical protein JOS77_29740 [Chromobacterium haemolyticum]